MEKEIAKKIKEYKEKRDQLLAAIQQCNGAITALEDLQKK
tara:strand:- start:40314 stop:40433 length:120 start_codon:yes stop_codon:yes gene_type:complete